MESRDFSVLDPNLALEKRIFLEASAGTGKTFAIEHFALRLMLEKGFRLDEILIVTFTKKATSELKARLFALIEKAHKALESGATFEKSLDDLPYLKNIKVGAEDGVESDAEDSEAALQKARALLSESGLSFEKASIYTLHAFGLKALEKIDFDASFSKEMPDPKGFIANFLNAKASSLDYSPHLLKKLMRAYGSGTCFTQAVLDMLCRSAFFAKLPSFSEVKKSLRKRLEGLKPPKDISALMQDLQALSGEYKGLFTREKKLKASISQVLEALGSSFISGNWDSQALGLFCEKAEGLVDLLSDANKKKKQSQSNHFSYFKALKKAVQDLEPLLFDPQTLLVQICGDIKEVVEKNRKEQKGLFVFSPDDILYALQKKLSSSKADQLCQKIAEPYKAVIIDEFQDTDPLQWDLFSRLFFERDQDIYAMVVGDPKQSIYGFRRADIYTFFEAKKCFGLKSAYHLATNYRSAPLLIQSLNKLFSLRKDGTFLHLPKTKKRALFTPSKAPNKNQALEGLGKAQDPFALECLIASVKGLPNIKAQKEKVFPWLLSSIMALRKKGAAFSDMAVLCKDRFQIEAFESYLSERAIPACVEGDYLAIEDKVYLQLKAFIEAVFSLHDRGKLAKSLTLFGFESELLLDADFFEEKAKLFEKLFEVASTSGLVALASAWSASFFMEEAKAFYELADLLEQKRYEKRLILSSPSSLEELFKAFEEILISKERSAKKGVRLTTIHKSKGLEYDYVFALGALQRTKGLGKVISPNGVIKPLGIASDSEKQNELTELDAEKLRAFYVALTRAKKKVYLPILLSEKEPALGEASCNEAFLHEVFELDKALKPLSSLERDLEKRLEEIGAKVTRASLSSSDLSLEESLDDPTKLQQKGGELLESEKGSSGLAAQAEDAIETYNLAKLKACFSKTNQVLSYSSITSGSSSGHTEEKTKEALSATDVPAGPKIGIWIHEVLRVLFESGTYQNLDEKSFEKVCKRLVPYSFFNEYKTPLFNWVQEALETPLEGIGRIKDIAWKDILIEQPFMWRFSETDREDFFMKGIIDLIVHVDGELHVVDWKSNYLQKYDKEHLEKAMHDHGYFVQAGLYRAAIEKMAWPWKASFAKAHYVFLRGGALSFEPAAFDVGRLSSNEEALCQMVH